MSQQMRVAIGQYHTATDEYLTYAQQLGVSGVQFNIQGPTQDLPGSDGYWTLANLRRLKQRVNDFGLQLEAIENVPRNFYLKAMLGLPGEEAQISNYQRSVQNMGAAGIPLLGLNWMPGGVWRTPTKRGRGGVTVTAFDLETALAGQISSGDRQQEYSESQLLESYLRFMEQVLPVAEASDVKIALHPDDPPLPALGRQERLFYKAENFRKVLAALPSPAHGLDFCMGCFSEMLYADCSAGEGVLDAIRHFGCARPHLLHTFSRRAGQRTELPGMLPERGQCRPGGDPARAARSRLRRLPHRRPRPCHVGRQRLASSRARLVHGLSEGAGAGCAGPLLSALALAGRKQPGYSVRGTWLRGTP